MSELKDFDVYQNDPDGLRKHREDVESEQQRIERKNLPWGKDECFDAPTKAQKLADFKYSVIRGVQINGLSAEEFHKNEIVMCSKCKEPTLIIEPCCGVEYVR